MVPTPSSLLLWHTASAGVPPRLGLQWRRRPRVRRHLSNDDVEERNHVDAILPRYESAPDQIGVWRDVPDGEEGWREMIVARESVWPASSQAARLKFVDDAD